MSVGHGQEVRLHVGRVAVWKITSSRTFLFVVVVNVVVIVVIGVGVAKAFS